MSNELFYVNDLNKFTRYSDSERAIVEYEVYGLQIGFNLPPITDHFHWCRSTITYNLDTSIPDITREGLKIANDADKEQYERYKRYFEDKIPDGVENFVRWRYNNPDEWEKLKKEYPEMKLRYKIKNEYDLNINIDKFNRHVENTEQYQKYLNKQSTPSVLNIDIYEAQKIINEYAGTGELIRNNGNFQNKEFITTDIIVGRVFDINSTWKDTNKLIIHYSKTGAYIVPTLRR